MAPCPERGECSCSTHKQNPDLQDMRPEFDLFKEPRGRRARHDSLPHPEAAVVLVVGVSTLVRVVAVVGEEERLHHWLVHHRRDDRETDSFRIHRGLIEVALTLRVSTVEMLNNIKKPPQLMYIILSVLYKSASLV